MQFLTTSFAPHGRLPLHARGVDYLSLVLAGSYEETIGSTRLHCLPLSVRLHPAGEEHAHGFGRAGARCLNIELPGSWQRSVDRVLGGLGKPVVVALCSSSIVPLITRAQQGEVDLVEEVAVALMELCERQAAVERAPIRNRAIRRAMDRVNDELPHTLSLTELALEAELHPTHFARSFKAFTGQTVGQFVRLRRCAYAQRLLATNAQMSISRVALASGFADHAHFTRTLRDVTGLSPTQYRTLLRNGMLPNPRRPPQNPPRIW